MISGTHPSFVWTPAAHFNGTDVAQYRVSDEDGGLSNTVAVTVTVTAVNDAPGFTKGPDVTVAEDAGARTAAGWASAISAGPVDESGRAVRRRACGPLSRQP